MLDSSFKDLITPRWVRSFHLPGGFRITWWYDNQFAPLGLIIIMIVLATHMTTMSKERMKRHRQKKLYKDAVPKGSSKFHLCQSLGQHHQHACTVCIMSARPRVLRLRSTPCKQDG